MVSQHLENRKVVGFSRAKEENLIFAKVKNAQAQISTR